MKRLTKQFVFFTVDSVLANISHKLLIFCQLLLIGFHEIDECTVRRQADSPGREKQVIRRSSPQSLPETGDLTFHPQKAWGFLSTRSLPLSSFDLKALCAGFSPSWIARHLRTPEARGHSEGEGGRCFWDWIDDRFSTKPSLRKPSGTTQRMMLLGKELRGLIQRCTQSRSF